MTNQGFEIILGRKTPVHEQIKTIPTSKYLVRNTETNPKFTWQTTYKQRNTERVKIYRFTHNGEVQELREPRRVQKKK